MRIACALALAIGLVMARAPFVHAERALDPLIRVLGPDAEVGYVSWKPVDFRKAAAAGFTTVWLGVGPFLGLPAEEQLSILSRAEESGLPRLGFIGGDPEWVNPKFPGKAEKAVREYRHLADVLEDFIRRTPSGRMRFVWATDIEPYVKKWWDGDLAPYSALLGKAVLPPLKELSARYPGRVEPLLTRFEPFWWENGHVAESGKTLRGLRDFPSVVASMTYRNTAAELLNASRSVRQRARQADGLSILLGVETKSPAPGVPEFITFSGHLDEIPEQLIGAIQALPSEDRENLQGIFIHSGKKETDQILDDLLLL